MIALLADSNALENPVLRSYLEASRDHVVLLSDLVLIEMRKKRALSTSRGSLRIVASRPSQMYLLRPTHEVVAERIASSADATALFDFPGTIELEGVARALGVLPTPAGLAEYMVEAEKGAAWQFETLRQEVIDLEPAMIKLVGEFSASEVSRIRRFQPVDEATKRKVWELLKDTTRDSIVRNQLPPKGYKLGIRDAMGMFAFRYALCIMIYYLNWVADGSTVKKLDRRVNDVIDLQIAAMATFFNGVLSMDKQVRSVSQGARAALRNFGSFVGDDWTPAGALVTADSAQLP